MEVKATRAVEPVRIGWRLVLEPVLESLGWSLIRAQGGPHHGTPTTHHVWAGRLDRTDRCRRLVDDLLPSSTAVWAGPLADPEAELHMARELGAALLPDVLREALAQGSDAHTLTVATRGWCAGVPWELLVVDDADTRLLERCRVLVEAHPLAGVDRPPLHGRPSPQGDEPAGLVVLDPGPLGDDDPALAPLYPAGLHVSLSELAADWLVPGLVTLDRDALGTMLRSRRWARFMYAGHILPGSLQDPANVALLLSDGVSPDRLTAYEWLDHPEIWPAPARVALLGCGSGDGRPMEDVGLALAALRAGAELVTTTRWVLPTDMTEDAPNFSRLVLAVHAAHASDDPVGHLRDWQLTELHRWRASGHPLHAPLTWAAPFSTILYGLKVMA